MKTWQFVVILLVLSIFYIYFLSYTDIQINGTSMPYVPVVEYGFVGLVVIIGLSSGIFFYIKKKK